MDRTKVVFLKSICVARLGRERTSLLIRLVLDRETAGRVLRFAKLTVSRWKASHGEHRFGSVVFLLVWKGSCLGEIVALPQGASIESSRDLCSASPSSVELVRFSGLVAPLSYPDPTEFPENMGLHIVKKT